MSPSNCEQLKTELQSYKSLKKEFYFAYEEALKTGNEADIERAEKIKAQIEEMAEGLEEKFAPKEIKAVWNNPETGEKKEIILNIGEQIKYYRNFYKQYLNLEIKDKEIIRIWNKNKKEIQRETEAMGYDRILILPDNIPDEEELNEKLIETMTETIDGKQEKVDDTYQSSNFEEGGSFHGLKNVEKPETRIILTKNAQNMKDDPLLKKTLNKTIIQLTGLTPEEADRRIQNQESLSIDFEALISGQKIKIQAEGLSLKGYMVFQRAYFDENKKHLDETSWTWLLKSFSGSRVVGSSWGPGTRRLDVSADAPGSSGGGLGGRLSRSFSG